MYSDLFWDHDQLLSCWAWSTVTFEGKGLTYSPLVSYVFSVLHTELTPHTSIFTFTRRRPSVGDIRQSYIYGVSRWNRMMGLVSSSIWRARECRVSMASTRGLLFLFFFFFYLVWWHLTLNPRDTPTSRPDHTIPITALLSGSCVRVGAHAWSNEPERCVSRFFCRDAFLTLARTVRRRNRIVPLSRDSHNRSDLGRARWKDVSTGRYIRVHFIRIYIHMIFI